MKDWQLQLALRWEALRNKGRALGWHNEGSPFLVDLAKQRGLSWYRVRADDRTGDFMAHDAEGLFDRLPGFGRIKCQRLIEVLEAVSEGVEVAQSVHEGQAQAFTLTCAEVLELWGVPVEYPLQLLPLSTRLMNFCQSQKITTLPMLLEVWASIGRAGLLSHENIGRSTADELQAFANAIAHADAETARLWLPLNDAENGLCLRRALALNHGAHSERERRIVARRIVDDLKLEEVGAEYGMTRERVRQLEASYLRGVRETLNWFAPECATMLEAWMAGDAWQAPVLPQSTSEAETLILAAIEACFADTPQGVARRLSAESEMQGWLDTVIRHPDLHLGGLDLQSLLDSNVPLSRQADFVSELASKPSVVIDHASGLVKPSSSSVRDTLCAILSQEEEPIPLTWLARRVQSVEGCEEGDANFIFRNRYRWSQLGFLDLSRVLWHE